MDAAGNLFVPRGINVMHGGNDPSAATIKSVFPNLNFIRLAIYNYDTPESLAPEIQDLTSAGIVVELENHNNGAGNAGGSVGSMFSGQALTNESNWYASVAKAFASNPNVWFGTNNEPSRKNASGQTDPAGLSHWQKATYDAVRGAGNQSPVFVEAICWPEGGKPVCNQGFDPADYAAMTNAVWDYHFYGWQTNYQTDQALNDQYVADNIAALASIKSAGNTVMPVVIAEYGNGTDGINIDPNGTQAVNAVNNAVDKGLAAGAAAWAWGSGNPADGLTTGGSSLSSYGQQVASAMTHASPTAAVCAAPTTTATGTPSGQTPQTQTALLQTGSGSQSPNGQPNPQDPQANPQKDTVAAATAGSLQATSNASNAVDAAVKQAQTIQPPGGRFSADSPPGVQAIGAQ